MRINLILIIACLWCNGLFAQKNPCDTAAKGVTAANGTTDTTITLENGTKLTFNRCEFFDIKDCVDYQEIRSLKDLKANGLSTLDNQGNVLLSCGMFKLDFISGNCEKKCLDVPVRIRIPMLFSSCASSSNVNRLYLADSTGKWKPLDSTYKEVTGDDGKKYFEFYARCGGKFNCDSKLRYTIVKFKAKKGRALYQLNLSSNCPLVNMSFSTGRRKNIIYAKVPCMSPDSLLVTVSGDGIDIIKTLSHLKTKFTPSKCEPVSRKVVRNILGIFKFRERNIYRKYILE